MNKNGFSLYNVMTRKKGVLVNFRISKELRDDFLIVAEMKGSSMSGLLYPFIVKTVREEKQAFPTLYEETKAQMLAESINEEKTDSKIDKSEMSREEIQKQLFLKEADVLRFDEAKPKKTDRTKTHIVGRAIEMDVPEYDENELKKIKNEVERNALKGTEK